MDRLKHRFPVSGTLQGCHLHSNMDRLKRQTIAIVSLMTRIYIPIWID